MTMRTGFVGQACAATWPAVMTAEMARMDDALARPKADDLITNSPRKTGQAL
jgi:hypothetical protein